ncbi:hypothetical protein cypCar_00013471 [Cyprinus carpio]|nr:hypothetical protein cypCar_00013471 [Cyprinus carpio]
MRLHANDPVDPSAQNMDDDAAVQTILLVQESTSSSPSSSSSAMPVVQEGMLVAEEGSSSVVFLHPNLTMPTITVPTISVPNISVVADIHQPQPPSTNIINDPAVLDVLSNARPRDSDEEILSGVISGSVCFHGRRSSHNSTCLLPRGAVPRREGVCGVPKLIPELLKGGAVGIRGIAGLMRVLENSV